MSNFECARYTFGEFTLDPAERVLWQADRPFPLTPKAIDILIALVDRRGHIDRKSVV